MPKAKSKSAHHSYGTRQRPPVASGTGTERSQCRDKEDLSEDQLARVVDSVFNRMTPRLEELISPVVNTPPSGEATGQPINLQDFDSFNQAPNAVMGIQEDIQEELGSNVPESLRQKIVNGEYIDLGQLLAKPVTHEQSAKLTVVGGELRMSAKTQSIKIMDIDKWTDAFLVFISLYGAAHPTQIAGMLKYMHTVRLRSRRTSGLGWKQYDEQFRLRKARNPSASWGVVDQELWLLYLYINHQPQQVASVVASPALKCYDFNYSNNCSKNPCPYMHKCLRFSGNHPSMNCYRAMYTNNSNFKTGGFRNGGRFRVRSATRFTRGATRTADASF
ncbi:LOW QUALITY PROTEIN: uncharacterized protein LOC117315208 [Pecten maximus]|uniref:LOW QUALITY PROTEIN: uncharacterized protein LOC117315208 n=1 Tax=Pecten maximus TaxID=6579 RepID=UPI001457F3DC|nr:LOW QUALITY PROTEIN: uncharacterized protein LOC117315208 [Pecten maximus]